MNVQHSTFNVQRPDKCNYGGLKPPRCPNSDALWLGNGGLQAAAGGGVKIVDAVLDYGSWR